MDERESSWISVWATNCPWSLIDQWKSSLPNQSIPIFSSISYHQISCYQGSHQYRSVLRPRPPSMSAFRSQFTHMSFLKKSGFVNFTSACDFVPDSPSFLFPRRLLQLGKSGVMQCKWSNLTRPDSFRHFSGKGPYSSFQFLRGWRQNSFFLEFVR